MNEEHDRTDALSLQLRGIRIRGRCLVEERQIASDRRPDDLTGAGECRTDEADLHPADRSDCGGWKEWFPSRILNDIRGEVLEPRAVEAVAVLASVLRMAAAASQAQDLVVAFVELVVADGRDRETHRIECLDRRFVVKHRR